MHLGCELLCLQHIARGVASTRTTLCNSQCKLRTEGCTRCCTCCSSLYCELSPLQSTLPVHVMHYRTAWVLLVHERPMNKPHFVRIDLIIQTATLIKVCFATWKISIQTKNGKNMKRVLQMHVVFSWSSSQVFRAGLSTGSEVITARCENQLFVCKI